MESPEPVGGRSVADSVVDLETALQSNTLNNTDCVIQKFNPGYTRFLEMEERYSPHFVLLGGHRASGKTTITDVLSDKVNRNFVKVRTHVTRAERRSEKPFVPVNHVYVEKEDFIRNFEKGEYGFVYCYRGNFYGVSNDVLINLRTNENTFPVFGVVSPLAFAYLLQEELFPNAITAIITTNSLNDTDIRDRITLRYAKEKITDKEHINQAIVDVVADKQQFEALHTAVDMVFVNNAPQADAFDRSKVELHALRIEEYMKWHRNRFYSGTSSGTSIPTKPDNMRIFTGYIDSLIQKLFGSDFSLPGPGSSAKVNLRVIRSAIIDYIFKNHLKPRYQSRAVYKNGILYRHNGLVQLLFPQNEYISRFELDYLTSVNRIRFGAITFLLGDSFVIDNDGMGVYYALSDLKQESSEAPAKSPHKLYIGFRHPSQLGK